jgi:hypothetical protein
MNLNEQTYRIKQMMGILIEASIDKEGNIIGIESNIFDEFPEDVLETFQNNYSYTLNTNYDWNNKMGEFKFPDGSYDTESFHKWLNKNKQNEFIRNINKIISDVRHDLLIIKRRKLAKKKLEAFEDLIIPVFGNHITGDALSKFEEQILMNPDATIEDIEKGHQEAKNIIDAEGNIDSSKLEKSLLFPNGEINIPNFERFVDANPEYKKTYDIWWKLFKDETNLLLAKMNALYIINYNQIKKLYNFLLKYKKQLK